MKILYTLPEIVDELTHCKRRLKGSGTAILQQPYIAKNFDEFMGGVDIA